MLLGKGAFKKRKYKKAKQEYNAKKDYKANKQYGPGIGQEAYSGGKALGGS